MSQFEYKPCPLFDTRHFHNWRWTGWPLTSTNCLEKWCDECSLLKKVIDGRWQDFGYRNEPLKVGEVRQQSALIDASQPVIVKMGNRYFKALKAWPDTDMSPRGRAFYIEIEEDEYREVSM